MSRTHGSLIPRRQFVKQAGALSLAGLSGKPLPGFAGRAAIVADQTDAHISSRPVQWAIEELRQALESHSIPVIVAASPSEVSDASVYVVVAGTRSPLAANFGSGNNLPAVAEAFRLQPGRVQGKNAVLAWGSDRRGFVYALLELADRVRLGSDAQLSLIPDRAIEEQPANQVRSICRSFVSDVEDKTWYYDKTFWRAYLTDLATNRFNRFSLAFGIGYDFPRHVTGDYFHFVYPYLFAVPGYDVRVTPLTDAERDKNLEMLKFITEETALRGLECQIGIWTHAYQWTDSPHSDHHVEGLTAETHASYSRDALALLLKECPSIQGITMRVHGESGIPEGSYTFWQTVFEGISSCGRPVEIDMHAKGLDSKMIETALATRMPVKVSPKYWAEHMGLGYHQAAIREVEMPRPDSDESGVFKLSSGSRRFLRYGYGDLFKQGRKFGVLFRIWPGTQRTLLWGDPALAAGYGHASHFCGASGVEIFEPLFFKGRQGSGLPGGRCAYSDASLTPKDGDWSKYRYTYRVWGRNLFSPETDADGWRRYLRKEFKNGAAGMEQALANASRILPLVTTAHLPSAANNSFWPEMYTNMPIVEGSEREPYSDTPTPKRFGTVSPLDPELFSTIEQHSAELLENQASGKYSPIEVAHWLDDLANKAVHALTAAGRDGGPASSPEFRRFEEDIRIQAGLGQFFAAKLRSGVLYGIYQQTRDKTALQQAISSYRKARSAWSSMAERARTVYRPDITYGPQPIKRGHWMDRLAAIDTDLAAMEALQTKADANTAANGARGKEAAAAAMAKPQRSYIQCTHTPPRSFEPGKSVLIELRIAEDNSRQKLSQIALRYRRVNQAERWQSVEMEQKSREFKGAIPGGYSESPYALQYYFELRRGAADAWLYPGLNATFSNQPYFVIPYPSQTTA